MTKKMEEEEKQYLKSGAADEPFDRRSVLTGAAAVALAGAMPELAVGQPAPATKEQLLPHLFAGVYEDLDYLNQFNNKTYANASAVQRQIHDALYPNDRGGLKCGFYQQKLEPDPTKWGSKGQFANWYIFRDEMRENLEKQQPIIKGPENAMDPSNTSKVAANFLDHLDEVIGIALWDPPGIQVKIGVTKKSAIITVCSPFGTLPRVPERDPTSL